MLLNLMIMIKQEMVKMGKIGINKNITAEFKDFWTRKISIKDYFNNLFKDTTKQVAVVLIQNAILFASALLVILIIPYIAGNTLIPEYIRAILAGFVVLLPLLVMASFDRVHSMVQSHYPTYQGTGMVISAIIVVLMATILTYVMVNGDIGWVNVIVCIIAILGSAGYLAKVIIDIVNRRKAKNATN